MTRLLALVKGFPGHPSHPPLTDASIGAYTAGVAMLVAGALGLQEPQMAHGALLAISVGLLIALPTAVTGLLDWLELEPGTPRRTLATVHLLVMLAATGAFAAAWLAQRPGYLQDEVTSFGLVLGLVGEALLAAGGYIGGTLVFVHGYRVLGRPDTPVPEALRPAPSPPGGQASVGPADRGDHPGSASSG